LHDWTEPYEPTPKFVHTFWLNVFPSKSLHQLRELKGGGPNAAGREAEAALLNSTSTEVDYYPKPVHVAAAVLNKLNSQACPLSST